jgi:hypothetical protein
MEADGDVLAVVLTEKMIDAVEGQETDFGSARTMKRIWTRSGRRKKGRPASSGVGRAWPSGGRLGRIEPDHPPD